MKKKNGATILPFPSGLSSKDKKRARLSSQACGHIIEWAHENGLDVEKKRVEDIKKLYPKK